jgi:hypothetical protein
MESIKKWIKHNLIWLVVLVPILISLLGTQYELAGFDIRNHFLWGIILSPFNNLRYSNYIIRKFFLVTIAFFVLVFWLKKQKTILPALKNNYIYLVAMGLILVISRILTFNFWFYSDDLRFFNWQLYAPTLPHFDPQSHWGPYQTYPIAFFLLFINIFKTNYTLYNILGIFFYFLVGIAIFTLGNILQKNKFISFIAALFFLTTPTNFQGRLLVGEIVGSPFAILLILISLCLLLKKFLPGSLIFAAAALEFGVARTYIVALPLTLFAIFFIFNQADQGKVKVSKRALLFLVVSVIGISLLYLNSFLPAVPKSRLLEGGVTGKVAVFGDVLLAVITPLSLSQPLIKLLNPLLHNWVYLTTALGFLSALVIFLIGLAALIKKRFFAAKLITIGLSIVLSTAFISSLMGVRVDRNVLKLAEYVINSTIPTGATGYGILPALGLSIILIGVGLLVKNKIFVVLSLSLIIVNITSSYVYDFRWMRSPYGIPQRKFNDQLQNILFRDGIKKYIFVPPSQQPFYQGINTFADIFQGDQVFYRENDLDTFVKTIAKEKPPADHIYFLSTNGYPKYDVFDYSDKIRNVPTNKLSQTLRSLLQQLIPKRTEFFVF